MASPLLTAPLAPAPQRVLGDGISSAAASERGDTADDVRMQARPPPAPSLVLSAHAASFTPY
jgi:hypothetical protein